MGQSTFGLRVMTRLSVRARIHARFGETSAGMPRWEGRLRGFVLLWVCRNACLAAGGKAVMLMADFRQSSVEKACRR